MSWWTMFTVLAGIHAALTLAMELEDHDWFFLVEADA